jgi:hypothetical protein
MEVIASIIQRLLLIVIILTTQVMEFEASNRETYRVLAIVIILTAQLVGVVCSQIASSHEQSDFANYGNSSALAKLARSSELLDFLRS